MGRQAVTFHGKWETLFRRWLMYSWGHMRMNPKVYTQLVSAPSPHSRITSHYQRATEISYRCPRSTRSGASRWSKNWRRTPPPAGRAAETGRSWRTGPPLGSRPSRSGRTAPPPSIRLARLSLRQNEYTRIFSERLKGKLDKLNLFSSGRTRWQEVWTLTQTQATASSLPLLYLPYETNSYYLFQRPTRIQQRHYLPYLY